MKIIKGSLKGRNIICPPDIRPVSVRVKKSCFDILRNQIEGKTVLDLFAGSGALGIEALSCGAGQVVFVDIKKTSVEMIKKNLTVLKFNSQSKVYFKDVFSVIPDYFLKDQVFDLIFLDPPYYKGLLIKALQTLEEHDILSPSGYIIGFCYIKDDFLKSSNVFSLIEARKYGQTRLLIYRRK